MFEPDQIAPARKRLGLTQTDLAKKSGVSQSLVAKIEAGILDPSFTRLKAISDVLERLDATPRIHAEHVMQRDVVMMYATDAIELAIDHVARHGISQLPVFDDGVLVGTVTESSLLAHIGRHRGDSGALQAPVREVMTAALPQVPPETRLDGLVSLLEVFPAVLVSANGRILGIVTKTDLIRGAAAPGTTTGPRAGNLSRR